MATDGEAYKDILSDPTFRNLVESVVKSRMSSIHAEYEQHFRAQEQELQQRKDDFYHMEATAKSLATQLAEAQLANTNTRKSSAHEQNTEMAMADITAQSKNKEPTVATKTRKPRFNKNAGLPPNAGPTPTRTLRSSTHVIDFSPAASTAAVQTPTSPVPVVKATVKTPPQPPKHRRPSEMYRLMISDVPPEALMLKTALVFHIRFLWGLLDPRDLPSTPSDKEIGAFNARFSEDNLYDVVGHGDQLVPTSRIKVGLAVSVATSGKLAGQARRVEQHIREYMMACISRFGLTRWAPDLRETPYSIYNAACRIIALDTFKQAIAAHAYAHISPNASMLNDITLLIKMYDHFVHYYVDARVKKESRNAGSVRAADEANPAYKNRSRLAAARRKFLAENAYPQRYLDVVDVKATSDDEADEVGTKEGRKLIYWIRTRPERSDSAETFIRLLDKKREDSARLDPRKQWRERLRRVPKVPVVTEFTAVPLDVPIDYFKPDFFNKLQPDLRLRVTNQQIAFLPDPSESFGPHEDEKLSDDQFMDKYGMDVLDKYALEEMDGWGETGGGSSADHSDGEDEDMDPSPGAHGDKDHDMADVSSQRLSLVKHLSTEDV